MADSSVIREFLVALGFKVDEKGLKNFKTGVEDATKGVVKLVAAISGAALTVGAGVSAFASKLEALYFVSQRVGASANNIRALEGAAKDFGVSAEAARGTVEKLAAYLRNDPSSESYLASLGVKTRDANGNLRDTVDLLGDIGSELAKRPQWLANQAGEDLGIDPNLLLAYRDPAFLERIRQVREVAQNNGMDKATRDAHAWMNMLRGVGRQFDNLAVQIEAALLGKAGPQLAQFSEWFTKNGQMIAERVADIIVAFLNMIETVGPAVKTVADWFIAADKATDGWSTKIVALIALMKVLGGFAIISGITSLAGAFSKLAIPIAAIAASGFAGWEIGKWINENLVSKVPGLGNEIGETVAKVMAKLGSKEAQEALDINTGKLPPSPAGAPVTGKAVDAVGFFQKMGWTKDQASGIVANLRAESGLRPDNVGDSGKAYGIAQWHPDRQADFAKWAGKDIRNSSLMEQLGFVHHELTRGNAMERRAGALLRAAQNAQQAGEIVSRHYERPAEADAEAAKRGRGAVQIAQDVQINVNGAGDPQATARAVANEQSNVNADMVREFGWGLAS